MRFGRRSISLTVVMLMSAACGNAPDAAQQPASICVDIPNGSYFQVVDGRLTAITSTQLDARERPTETARRIGATLAGMGYPWVLLDWDGQVATVSGLALDENTRSDAFIATKSAFLAASALDRQLNGETVDWADEFERPLQLGIETFRTYVEAWYRGDFQTVVFAKHTTPEPMDLLANLFDEFCAVKCRGGLSHGLAEMNTVASSLRNISTHV